MGFKNFAIGEMAIYNSYPARSADALHSDALLRTVKPGDIVKVIERAERFHPEFNMGRPIVIRDSDGGIETAEGWHWGVHEWQLRKIKGDTEECEEEFVRELDLLRKKPQTAGET